MSQKMTYGPIPSTVKFADIINLPAKFHLNIFYFSANMQIFVLCSHNFHLYVLACLISEKKTNPCFINIPATLATLKPNLSSYYTDTVSAKRVSKQ